MVLMRDIFEFTRRLSKGLRDNCQARRRRFFSVISVEISGGIEGLVFFLFGI